MCIALFHTHTHTHTYLYILAARQYIHIYMYNNDGDAKGLVLKCLFLTRFLGVLGIIYYKVIHI